MICQFPPSDLRYSFPVSKGKAAALLYVHEVPMLCQVYQDDLADLYYILLPGKICEAACVHPVSLQSIDPVQYLFPLQRAGSFLLLQNVVTIQVLKN